MTKVFRDWLLLCGFVLLVALICCSFASAQNVGACPCHVNGAACYCQPASICPNCPAPAVQYVSYQVGSAKAPPVKMPAGPAAPSYAANDTPPRVRFPAAHAVLERQPVRTVIRRVFQPFSRLRCSGRGCG